MLGTLSVRENFHFSAALRLPSTVSAAEREDRVNSVIQELGLVHCADTKVIHMRKARKFCQWRSNSDNFF